MTVVYNDSAIPDAVLENQVRISIPVVDVNWSDDRICCGFARRGDIAGMADCPMLGSDSEGTWCRVNGAARRSPCVADEPENSEVWERIREQRELAKEAQDET